MKNLLFGMAILLNTPIPMLAKSIWPYCLRPNSTYVTHVGPCLLNQSSFEKIAGLFETLRWFCVCRPNLIRHAQSRLPDFHGTAQPPIGRAG